jgi:nitrogen-specific signal transduction histidine kinase
LREGARRGAYYRTAAGGALDAERNRVLIQTAGAAAHELSQPLSVILAASQLLLRNSSLEGKARERTEFICEQAKKSQALMSRIVDVRQYVTRPYAGDTHIVDFGAGVAPEE